MRRIIYYIILICVTHISTSQNKEIEITFERKPDNTVDFFYSKNVPGTYSLRLEFTSLENSYESRIYKKVLKYYRGRLLTLKPIDENSGISFAYKITYSIGDPNPKVDNSIHYCLPFINGKTNTIFEASNIGESYFENEKPIGWKSFVAISDKSDTICSMRKGKVIKIIDTYENDSTLIKEYTSKRNHITIEHEDGTYAVYTGFDKNKIFVKPGQNVYPQTKLGAIEIFNKTTYRLDFNVYHYLENILDTREKETLSNRKYRVKYLNPLFITNKGLLQIESGTAYITTFSDDTLLQEFSRKERKKHKKNPELFKN